MRTCIIITIHFPGIFQRVDPEKRWSCRALQKRTQKWMPKPELRVEISRMTENLESGRQNGRGRKEEGRGGRRGSSSSSPSRRVTAAVTGRSQEGGGRLGDGAVFNGAALRQQRQGGAGLRKGQGWQSLHICSFFQPKWIESSLTFGERSPTFF